MNTNKRIAKSTLQVENDIIKVVRWSFNPEESTGWHKHEHDYLVIPLEDGQLMSVNKMDKTILDLKKGKSYFKSAGVEHEVVNCNDPAFEFIEVELK